VILETYTGLAFDYDDPQPEMIALADIARALSLTTRFGGHITRHYNVAAHSLLVRALVIEAGHPELSKPALLHDAHEAYVGDIPTPLKANLGGKYYALTATIDVAIGQALAIDHDLFHHPVVKQADADSLLLEAQRLKKSRAAAPFWQRVRDNAPDAKFPPAWRFGAYRDPLVAERAFLNAYARDDAKVVA
jgi:5'-deoxynucleotidase YfbR-like HD superfamily hydrolase